MPDILDTSVVVRYLTDDPPDQAELAAHLIERDEAVHVPETVLLEAGYVLRKGYGLTREQTVDALTEFVSRANVVVRGLDTRLVVAALALSRPSGRVSMGDGLIWAAARGTEGAVTYSFDERFPDAEIELRRPAQRQAT